MTVESNRVDAALEHVADALDQQLDADSLGAQVRAGANAAHVARAVIAGSGDIAELVLQTPAAEIARVLDALASPDDSPTVSPASDGPIAAWSHELQRLARRSGRKAADIAAAMARHGFRVPALDAPVVLDDPLLAESTVGALGGRWVEGSYRSLHRAAQREWTRRRDVECVERGVAGLNAVNVPTPGFAAARLHVPAVALPMRGRDGVIDEVAAALRATRRVQVLVGPAGHGKTTLAWALAARARSAGALTLSITAPDGEALLEGLEMAAVLTGATVQQLEAVRRLSAPEQPARLWALLDDSPRPWLLILDDAGPTAVGHRNWLHPSLAGHVVITSRHGPAGWGDDADVTSIGQLRVVDGARVVLDQIDGEHSDGDTVAAAEELSRRLRGMPLALASAGRLARTGTPSLSSLLEQVRDSVGQAPLAAVYEIGLNTTPARTRELLRMLACFAPDESLPQRVVSADESLAALLEAGLVEETTVSGQPCLRLHPALAEHARRDSIFDGAATSRLTARAVALLATELAALDAGLASDWPSICLLEPHVMELVESSCLDDRAVLADVLVLADRTAEALVRAGRQTAAAALLDRALDVTKGLGDGHRDRLAARRTAAWMMAFNRDLRTAELLLHDILDDTLRCLGPDDPYTLAARDSVAWLRAERGATEESRVELARILVVRRRVFGDRHPATLATWQRLAWVSGLCHRERYASEQLRQILHIRLEICSPDHLDVFSTRYRLAWVLVRLGELEQGEQHFRALNADLHRVVGDRHPFTLMVRTRIGWVLKRRKRFTAARRVYTEVLGDQVEVLGHGHPRVLRTQHLLACLDLQLGRYGEAVQALRLAAEDREHVLGPDHFDTLNSRSYLAWALFQAGDAAAADREFTAVLADRIRVYGARHRRSLMTRGFHGRVLMKRGMLHEAGRRLSRLLVDQTNLLGTDDRFVFETRHSLAVVMGHLGRLEECEAELRSVGEDRSRVLGPEHPDTLAARDYLTWAMALRGRLPEATELCAAVLADRTRILGTRHPHTLGSRYRSAWLAGQQGHWDESLCEARQLLPELNAAMGKGHPDTLRCRLWTARCLRFQGRLDEAAREAREVVVARARLHGAAAVDTLRAREELGLILLAEGARAEAATTFEALLRDRIEALGDHHPDTTRSVLLVANTAE